MGDMTLFEALAGGAFDHLKCQHAGRGTWVKRVVLECATSIHISYNAPYLPPKILHKHSFQFLLGQP